jgi:hypothetical protein
MRNAICFIFLISSNLAYASHWVSIWKRDSLEYFLDMDNVRKDGAIVETWTKTNPHLNNAGETITSVDFWRIDCNNYTSKFYSVNVNDNIEIATYSSNGNILISDSGIAFQIYKRFCQ